MNSSSGDYHLQASSPAIDAGLNSAAGIPATDYYDNPRIVAGRPDDYAIVDMGAAEFQPTAPIPTAVPTAMPTPTGNVINVPADYESIQGAIDSASDGDVVLVAPAVYFEAINFGGKAIQVVSTGGPQTTIIDGHGLGPVAIFTNHETTASALSGFTITGGLAITEPYATGGGIYIGNSSPTISNNIVSHNMACGGGGGIEIDGGSPVVTGNVITDNSQFGNGLGSCGGGDGGGIRIGGPGSSNALIASNTISNNSWVDGGAGGGVSLSNAGSPTLLNNLISGNLATGTFGCISGIPCLPEPDNVAWGGGISVDASNPNLIQNLIINNVADVGGGVYLNADLAGASPLMINNTVAGNVAMRDYGSAVMAIGLSRSATFINNILVARGNSNAVYCNDGTPTFENNDVFSAGGLSYVGDCTAGAGLPGSISVDPLFTMAASNVYTLAAGSPAIDIGLNNAPHLPATDFNGNPRIVAGHAGCTAVVDMGIAENQGAASGPCPTTPPKPSKFKVEKALSFGHRVQYSSNTETIKITNPEKGSPATIAFSIFGPYATDYGLSNDCPAPLANGGSCSLNVTFTPTTPVNETADLLILDGSDQPIAKVKLSGTTGRKRK